MVKDSFWDSSKRPHTKIKHRILRDYLSAWSKIFGNRNWCKDIYYIDCCSGRGKYDEQGKKDSVDGSPIIALEIAKIFKEKYKKNMICLFIEKDQNNYNNLKKFTQHYESEGLIFDCLKGDINNMINQVIETIPRESPVFFFIDPENLGIKRSTIQTMIEIPNIKEFLITYIYKGAERSLGLISKYKKSMSVVLKKRILGNFKKIKEIFGDDWKVWPNKQKDYLETYLKPITEFNKDCEPQYRLKAKIIDIYYNKGRSKYYLIFLSRNDIANKIIQDIFTAVKTEKSFLASRENKRIFQDKFNFKT